MTIGQWNEYKIGTPVCNIYDKIIKNLDMLGDCINIIIGNILIIMWFNSQNISWLLI